MLGRNCSGAAARLNFFMEGLKEMDVILLNLAVFALGAVMIIKGGDWFVDAASWIAGALHIPTFIIGATIVSVATTLPEMIVSLLAAGSGKVEMAIGNAVGSVTANTALIMAVAMLGMKIICPRKEYGRQFWLLIAAAAALYAFCLGGELNLIGCVVMAVIFVIFLIQNVQNAKGKDDGQAPEIKKGEGGRYGLLFVLGATGLAVGSQLLVRSGSALAALFGVPERVIAVTLVAVGTSLPELVTTVTAILKGQSSLSVGNILGANIIDLSLILPLSALVSGKALPVAGSLLSVDLPFCLGVTLVACVPILLREKATKAQGAALLAAYAGYLALVIL